MSQIAIKQEDWEAPFFPIMRNNSLTYSVNLFSIFARSPVVEAQLQKCQFCKSFPFLVSEQPEPSKVKECELCQSLNEHEMRHYLIDKGDEPQELSNSYIMKSALIAHKKVNLIIFIERLESQFVSSLTAALKSIVETQQIQACVLIPYHGSLAMVDFLDQPELIILSKDLCVRQSIEQCKCVLTVQIIQQLEKILMILSKDASNKNRSNIGYELLSQALIDFQGKRPQVVEIMLWIGKLPLGIKKMPSTCLKIIAVLLVDKTILKNSLLFDVGNQLAEVHYLYGEEASTQLYYELHKILNQEHLGFIMQGVATLKTDKKYSGSFVNPPKNLINSTSPSTIFTTNLTTPHKLQFNIEFTNFRGEHLRFISNLYETGKNRSIEWRERVFLISNALIHVLHTYYYIKANPQKPKEDISPSYIMNQLENFGQKYENNTTAYSQLLKHMISYFKEFQKSAIKQYLPFSLIFRKELLFLFYPLWQGGILHHYDSMWVSSEGEEYVDWCNEVMGVSWTPRQPTVPIFYSLCIDNGTYSFVQQ